MNSLRASFARMFVLILSLTVALTASSCSGPTGKWNPSDFFKDSEVIALTNAAKAGDVQKIDHLVAAGVNINTAGKDGMTPLLFAMWAKNKIGFEHLLKKGANPNLQIVTGDSVTSFAAFSVDDSEWLEIALEYGADPNLVDPIAVATVFENSTPIFNAIEGKNMKNLELLIKAGANLNHQDRSGTNPLNHATSYRWYKAVYRLLEAGADYRLKDDNEIDLALCCLIYHVNPDSKENYGHREKVINFLKEKGVDFEPAKKRYAEKYAPKP